MYKKEDNTHSFIQTNFESAGEFLLLSQETSENERIATTERNNDDDHPRSGIEETGFYIPIYGMEKQKDASSLKLVRFVVLSDTHLFHDHYNYWYDDDENNDPLKNGSENGLQQQRRRRDSFEEKKNEDTMIKLPKGDYLIHCGDFSNFCLPSKCLRSDSQLLNFLPLLTTKTKLLNLIIFLERLSIDIRRSLSFLEM